VARPPPLVGVEVTLALLRMLDAVACQTSLSPDWALARLTSVRRSAEASHPLTHVIRRLGRYATAPRRNVLTMLDIVLWRPGCQEASQGHPEVDWDSPEMGMYGRP
jgi:hypothetical protein